MKHMKAAVYLGVTLALYSQVVYGARKPKSVEATTIEASAEAVPDRSINVRVNPLGLLVGSLSADVDFAISDKFTIGPTLSYYSATLFTTTLSGFGIGARGNWYLSGNAMTDSWILGPQLGMSLFSISSGASKASSTGFYFGGIGGYQWVWKSGFNINLGLGANYYTQAGSAQASDGTTLTVPGFSGIGPTGELTVGWAF